MGKKKDKYPDRSHDGKPCARCLITTVDSRLDQVMDAYKDLQKFVSHYAGMEAWIRLSEGQMWFKRLAGDAHEQNIQHTCQPATTTTG